MKSKFTSILSFALLFMALAALTGAQSTSSNQPITAAQVDSPALPVAPAIQLTPEQSAALSDFAATSGIVGFRRLAGQSYLLATLLSKAGYTEASAYFMGRADAFRQLADLAGEP